jgi:hypothetical protein
MAPFLDLSLSSWVLQSEPRNPRKATSLWYWLCLFSRVASPVVVSAGEDHEQVTVQLIHQTVFSVDAARPAPGKVFTQGLGFVDASERIAQAGLD